MIVGSFPCCKGGLVGLVGLGGLGADVCADMDTVVYHSTVTFPVGKVLRLMDISISPS